MRYKYRALIVIPKQILQAMNNGLAKRFGGTTFELGASETGSNPATHYYTEVALDLEAVGFLATPSLIHPLAKAWLWPVHGKTAQLDLRFVGRNNVTILDSPPDLTTILTRMKLKVIR